jgi:hypothetical protein
MDTVMDTMFLASFVISLLTPIALVLILIRLREIEPPPPPPQVDLKPVIEAIKNIRIPEPKEVEFPKIEFPKIEIPPAKEAVLDLSPVIEAIKNIHIPEPKEIEFPKIEFPKIEIPPAKEAVLDLKPVIEAINALNTPRQAEPAPLREGNFNTETLQEIVAFMRVNQAEFQSGLEAFHRAMEKLLGQIPSGDKELDAQKEFMQKFEEAFVKIQEKAMEAVNENSLRLQEILAEALNKEAK